MPYLLKSLQEEADDNGMREFTEYCLTLEINHLAGLLNCFLFRLVRRIKTKSYFTYASLIGTLQCAILEIYRRQISIYEDSKMKPECEGGNGDIL